MNHKLFVYGTLKRGYYNYRLLEDKNNGQSQFIGEAIVECCPLVVHKYGIAFLLPYDPNMSGADKTPKVSPV